MVGEWALVFQKVIALFNFLFFASDLVSTGEVLLGSFKIFHFANFSFSGVEVEGKFGKPKRILLFRDQEFEKSLVSLPLRTKNLNSKVGFWFSVTSEQYFSHKDR